MGGSDEHFVTEFEALCWPREKWKHRDHVKLAYLYLRKYPLDEAAQRISAAIRAHNAARGIVDTPTTGYHETMTQAWLRLIHVTLVEHGPEESADAFVDRHPHLTQASALKYYYSRGHLMSAEAKATFVPPDLSPLPTQKIPKNP